MNRWTILAVLFLARTAMAFQFQAVAALSPFLIETFAISLAEIGLLIGLYLAPGVIVAIPGSTIAATIGEKRIVVTSLGLMLAGNVLMLLAPSYESLIAGRLISGAGGVVVNVVMTKFLVDWFAGKEISTALAILINSWPVGIALALFILPLAALAGGMVAALLTVTAIVTIGLAAFAIFYCAPDDLEATPASLKIVDLPYAPLIAAGLVWALYNAALAMVFSFGPAVLTGRGWSIAEAGTLTSLFMLVFAISLPLGGILADRTGRRDTIILVSLGSFVVLMPFLDAFSDALITPIILLTGVLFSLSGGPIISLPSTILPPAVRTFGMGVYFTIYYMVMMVAPRFAGGIADSLERPIVAFQIGATMSGLAILSLIVFQRLTRQ